MLAAQAVVRLEHALAVAAAAFVHGALASGPRARAGLALLLAAAAGAAALGAAARRVGPPLAAPWQGRLEGTIAAVSRAPQRWRVDLDDVVALPEGGGLPRRVRLRGERLSLDLGSFDALTPGRRVRVAARLRPPGGLRNPGSPDGAPILQRAGIGAVGRLADPALFARLPDRDTRLARSGLHRLRGRLASQLAAAGPGGALLRALALGDRGGLDEADREAFARLGLAHLLAVSGLHLGLVAAGAFALLRRAAARSAALAARVDARAVALVGGALVALAFALLAGWGVPVRRALVLLLGLAAGFVLGRPVHPLGPLALAALWILARDPMTLFAPGAQLSFAASAVLALGLRGPAPGVLQGLRASATALAVTAPLAALHWGGRAPLALAANALAVPWTALVLLPGALAATGCALLGDGPPAVWGVALGERIAALTLVAVRAAAIRAPGLAAGPRPDAAWLAGAALLAVGAIRLEATAAKLGLAVAVSAVIALAPVPSIAPAVPRLVVFDVGQGDAVLVQGRDAALLVDGGGAHPGFDLGRRAVLPGLAALGVERLDLLVASHADLDHRGGLVAVLEALPVGEVWLPPGGRDDPAFAALRRSARRRRVPLRERHAGSTPWREGDLTVEVLWPPAGALELGRNDRPLELGRNDRSLVLRVALAGHRVLLPGDLEAAGEAALLASGVAPTAEILKLPHHGSRSSSSADFLRAVAPQLAIASAPCLGRWGMPHAAVRRRVRDVGAALWWTGRDGAVRLGLAPRLHAVGTGPARRCDAPGPAR